MVYLARLTIMTTVLLLTACDDRQTLAPVVESNWRGLTNHETTHHVRPGETLYAIAFRYDLDYRKLAAINHIPAPYLLAVGQVLVLKPHNASLQLTPYTQSVAKPVRAVSLRVPRSLGTWTWPARGAIVAAFRPQSGQKGIEISGHKEQVIRAALSGTVAYAGDGLPGYGNLILLQHPHQYLSAYGYNARNLVHVGQHVHVGQPIAAMGMDTHHRYAVHFEIRKAGQPLNPKYYLPTL